MNSNSPQLYLDISKVGYSEKYYKIIWSEEELKWFFDNVIPPLTDSEVYFVSLSARNKLLSKEEQKELNLGRTEMFQRGVIREKEWIRFLRKIKQYECKVGSYTTKNNSAIPNHAIVCYFNINPSNVLQAYKQFSQTMNEYYLELATCVSDNKDKSNILYRIKKQDVLLMNCFQKNRGTKYWIDFDFDVPKNNKILEGIKEIGREVYERDGRHYIIETKGGYHLLASRNTDFDRDFNPKTIVEEESKNIAIYLSEGSTDSLEELGYEVMQNKNEMLPLPGTFQGGFKVKVIKE